RIRILLPGAGAAAGAGVAGVAGGGGLVGAADLSSSIHPVSAILTGIFSVIIFTTDTGMGRGTGTLRLGTATTGVGRGTETETAVAPGTAITELLPRGEGTAGRQW